MHRLVSRRALVVVLVVILGTALSSPLTAAPYGPDVIARFAARLVQALQAWQQPLPAGQEAKRSLSTGVIYLDPDDEKTKGGNPSTMGSCIDPWGVERPCPGGG